jgi:hypothetical protein
VNGGGLMGTTVWTGTAFNGCDVNEITLLHHRFVRGMNTSAQCNTRHITLTGRSVRVENNSYISQLEVVIKPRPGHDEPLKNVICTHDYGITIDIGSIAINTTDIICEILNDSAINHTTTLKGIP